MNKIETLAMDIALLSNASLAALAQELVKDYPTRAEALETFINTRMQDELRKIHEELGIG